MAPKRQQKSKAADASASVQNNREYIPAQKMNAPMFILPELENMKLQERKDYEGAVVEENLYGKIDEVVFSEYDVGDVENFPELTKEMYIERSE